MSKLLTLMVLSGAMCAISYAFRYRRGCSMNMMCPCLSFENGCFVCKCISGTSNQFQFYPGEFPGSHHHGSQPAALSTPSITQTTPTTSTRMITTPTTPTTAPTRTITPATPTIITTRPTIPTTMSTIPPTQSTYTTTESTYPASSTTLTKAATIPTIPATQTTPTTPATTSTTATTQTTNQTTPVTSSSQTTGTTSTTQTTPSTWTVKNLVTPPPTFGTATNGTSNATTTATVTATIAFTTNCPPFPIDCPPSASCTAFDMDNCPICTCPTGASTTLASCPQQQCLLDCGEPPEYRKDSNGCDLCECLI